MSPFPDFAPPAPPPGGDLVTVVPCRTNRHGEATEHAITILADWRVDTGHDLDAERVATAFGGFNTCLYLVDRVIPALRAATQLWTRTALAPIEPIDLTRSRRWTLSEDCDCPDAPWSYDTPQYAAEHARSVGHLARQHGISTQTLACFATTVSDAYGDLALAPAFSPMALPGTSAEKSKASGRLWDAGISPQRVDQLRLSHDVHGPMTDRSYILASYVKQPNGYLMAVLANSTSTDAAEWAISTLEPFDWVEPDQRAAWLALGASRQDAVELVRAHYPARCAADLAAAIDVHPRHAISALTTWARSGLTPTVPDLACLYRVRGNSWYAPSRQALEPFSRMIRTGELTTTLTHAALVLAACGSGPTALRHLHVRGRITTKE